MDKALDRVKILDLTHHIAGPYCTKILAGFGADVTKIEKHGVGDPTRCMGPFLNDNPGQERSGLFLYLNINKKSITLNLKSSTGVKIFKELVKDTDIVVESYKPGVMERLGLNYEILEEINPKLVMTSISNFGQNGPYRDYKSSHLIAFGMSIGQQDEKPVQVGGWIPHYITGIHSVVGTVTALYQRNETGSGQHVDISMWESCIMSALYPVVIYSYGGGQRDTRSYSVRMEGVYLCKDGYIGINAYTRYQWEMLSVLLEIPELLEVVDDPITEERFFEIKEIVASKVIQSEKMELFQSGMEMRIPICLAPTTQEILDSPQHKAREFFDDVEHPVIGKVTMPGAPFKMSETPWHLTNSAPLLGEHNVDIYCDRLGYTKNDLVRMREHGII